MQTYDSEKHHRSSIRLKGYDYSLNGAYFVTICSKDCILGKIENGNMVLSKIGEIAHECWNEIPDHFDYVDLDVFAIMPNHIHGIICMYNDDNGRGVQLNAPTNTQSRNFYSLISPKQKTLSVIIRTFKAAVTTQCRKNGYDSFQWQRNYYEHIVRNEDELNSVREYIINNPLKWELDRENPILLQG